MDCVRALLSRDAPSAAPGTDDAAIVDAILRGVLVFAVVSSTGDFFQ